jgi:CspA family cold shock protein
MVITAFVREWHDDEGWGVLDSTETPGGCWAHRSNATVRGHRRALNSIRSRLRRSPPGIRTA